MPQSGRYANKEILWLQRFVRVALPQVTQIKCLILNGNDYNFLLGFV
jgi:hypothetical protein